MLVRGWVKSPRGCVVPSMTATTMNTHAQDRALSQTGGDTHLLILHGHVINEYGFATTNVLLQNGRRPTFTPPCA